MSKSPMKTEAQPNGTTQHQEGYQGRPPGPFQPDTPWRLWVKKFRNHLKRRNIVLEEDQRTFFLDEVGMSSYALLETLLRGKEPEETNVEVLIQTLADYYHPKKLVLGERYRMMSSVQHPGQYLKEFYSTVQGAAKDCEFDKVTDVRDAIATMVFVSGIRNVDTRKRLLEKLPPSPPRPLEATTPVRRPSQQPAPSSSSFV